MWHWRSLVVLVSAVMLSTAAWAVDDGWRLEKEQDGIRVYSRAAAGSSIREIRGVVEVPGTLSSVVAVLSDVSAIRELSEVVAEAKVQQRQSDTRYQLYEVLDMPWPVSDRDLVNQREIRQDPQTLAVTITDVAAPEALPQQDDRVRIVKSRSQWTLTPLAGGKVEAEMRALTDPNGPIPSSVINSMSVGTPLKSLGKLRTLAQQPKYRNATLAFVRNPAGK